MNDKDMKDSLDNFMLWLDSPAAKLKYRNDPFLADCVKYAKDRGYGSPITKAMPVARLSGMVESFIQVADEMKDHEYMNLTADTMKCVANALRGR